MLNLERVVFIYVDLYSGNHGNWAEKYKCGMIHFKTHIFLIFSNILTIFTHALIILKTDLYVVCDTQDVPAQGCWGASTFEYT